MKSPEKSPRLTKRGDVKERKPARPKQALKRMDEMLADSPAGDSTQAIRAERDAR